MSYRQKGLTLIELIVALSVLAVITTTAVPALARMVQEQRVASATNQLVAHLQYARQEAVFRQINVAACPSTNGKECTGGNRWDQGFIIYADPNNSHQPDSTDDILRVVAADERLLLHSAGRTRVRFQSHGGAYGTNLTIRVCDRNLQARARAVIVSNPGRVRSTRDVDPAECDQS